MAKISISCWFQGLHRGRLGYMGPLQRVLWYWHNNQEAKCYSTGSPLSAINAQYWMLKPLCNVCITLTLTMLLCLSQVQKWQRQFTLAIPNWKMVLIAVGNFKVAFHLSPIIPHLSHHLALSPASTVRYHLSWLRQMAVLNVLLSLRCIHAVLVVAVFWLELGEESWN